MSDALIEATEASRRAAAELPHWQVLDGWLCRRLSTGGWKSTLLAANAAGHLAEAAWHHPELRLGFDWLEIRLHTHSAGGLTRKDFALAALMEQVLCWRPAPDSPLEGTPDEPRWRHVQVGGG